MAKRVVVNCMVTEKNVSWDENTRTSVEFSRELMEDVSARIPAFSNSETISVSMVVRPVPDVPRHVPALAVEKSIPE